MPSQQLKYLVEVGNNDIGCNSSSFEVSMSGPSGFSVSLPTSTVRLRQYETAYLWASRHRSASPHGDYPLEVTAARAETPSDTSSSTSYYKVYSSDDCADAVLAEPQDCVQPTAVVVGQQYRVNGSGLADTGVAVGARFPDTT